MYAALYYPHTQIRSRRLIRDALLTWDFVEYITPFGDYIPDYEDKDLEEAMRIIGRPRAPDDHEKNEIHLIVEELIQGDVPETFMYSHARSRGVEYEIWPQKLANKTWRILEDNRFAMGRGPNLDYMTSEAAGLTLMAIIADVLAGQTKARITDRGRGCCPN